MAKDRGENPFGIIAGAGEFIRMAQACRLDLDQDFAALGSFKVDLHDLKRFASFDGDGGTGFHHGGSPVGVTGRWPSAGDVVKRAMMPCTLR